MTQTEALKLALEALEACIDYIAPHTLQGEEDADTAEEAITAIKAALAQPVQPVQTSERNFCERCGKRLPTGFVEISIHTCTPPKERNT